MRRPRLTDTEREILRRYKAEGGAAALAEEFGLNDEWVVYRLAYREQVGAPRKRGQFKHDSPELTEALERYTRGEARSPELAAPFGLTPEAFRRIASSRGYHAPLPQAGLGALTEAQRQELLCRYAAGDDLDVLTAEYRLTAHAVRYLAGREGVHRPRRGRRPNAEQVVALKRYAREGNARARAAECGVAVATFRWLASHFGVRARKRASRNPRPLSPEQLEALKRYAREGNARARGAECGMGEHAFRNLAAKRGVRSARAPKREAVAA